MLGHPCRVIPRSTHQEARAALTIRHPCVRGSNPPTGSCGRVRGQSRHECGEHAGAMLGSVQLVKALARLLLIVSVSGAMPQPFAYVDGADVGGLRTIRRPVAVTLNRALRPADGIVLTRDGVRMDRAGRANYIHFGVPTARIGISPPGLQGALSSQAASARRFASRNSASLRGPPYTI